MGVWQLIYLGILMIGLGVNMAKHGEEKITKYNAGTSLIGIIIDVAILWAGGFFG